MQWRRKGLMTTALFGLLILIPFCSCLVSTVREGARIVGSEIYRTVELTAKIPIDLAKPFLVRVTLKGYLDDIELPDEVRARVEARIDSDRFVDEIVPWLLDLKEIYAPSDPPTGFDEHIREVFRPARDAVPGLEHSLFRFDEKVAAVGAEAEGGGTDEGGTDEKPESGGISPELTSLLVRAYDAIFLQAERSPLLASQEPDAATRARVQPLVEAILRNVIESTPESSELRAELAKILADPASVRALTYTGIEFVQRTAYSSYRRFHRRAVRRQQLRNWLRHHLDEDNLELIRGWLTRSNERHYGVLVVVDGLQGHLVEALALGSETSPFVRALVEELPSEDAEADRGAAEDAPARLAIARSAHAFLRSFAETGFRHSAYLPFFRTLYDARGRGIARSGVSTTPTLSVRNIPIALTGAPVAGKGGTDIPDFHFVDRDANRAFYFYGNDLLRLDELTEAAGLRTLFDRLEHLASLSACAPYDAGAHFSIDYLINLATGEGRRDFGEKPLLAELTRRSANELELRALRRSLHQVVTDLEGASWYRFISRATFRKRAEQLIEQIADLEDDSLPQLLVYYNPWPDHFAHFTGPFADEIVSPTGELNRLDWWLGQIQAVYADAGVLSETLFGMAGDHGLTTIEHAIDVEERVFGGLLEDGVRLATRKNSADEGEGPRLTDPLAPPSMRGYDVVVSATAGGHHSMDWFFTQESEWRRHPLARELREFRTRSGATIDVIEEVRDRLGESLDFLVVREEACSTEAAALRVVMTREGAAVETVIRRRAGRIWYDAQQDLLGLGELSPYDAKPEGRKAQRRGGLLAKSRRASSEDAATWLTGDEWRELASWCARPDAIVQLARLFDTERSSTMHIFPAPGYGYDTAVPGRHGGESFHEKDAFAGIWGAPVERTTRLQTASISAVAATIHRWLLDEDQEPGEGWASEPIELKE